MSEKFKRYMVFEDDAYAAAGGIDDCYESFDVEEEAIKYAEKSTYDDVHIFDRIEGKIIFQKD